MGGRGPCDKWRSRREGKLDAELPNNDEEIPSSFDSKLICDASISTIPSIILGGPILVSPEYSTFPELENFANSNKLRPISIKKNYI